MLINFYDHRDHIRINLMKVLKHLHFWARKVRQVGVANCTLQKHAIVRLINDLPLCPFINVARRSHVIHR